MPYIPYSAREELKKYLRSPATPGELNYWITQACLSYLRGADSKPTLHYKDYNEILGILEAVKLEFYRRLVSRYENKKLKETGDVY